jgi:hypothetical protein
VISRQDRPARRVNRSARRWRRLRDESGSRSETNAVSDRAFSPVTDDADKAKDLLEEDKVIGSLVIGSLNRHRGGSGEDHTDERGVRKVSGLFASRQDPGGSPEVDGDVFSLGVTVEHSLE